LWGRKVCGSFLFFSLLIHTNASRFILNAIIVKINENDGKIWMWGRKYITHTISYIHSSTFVCECCFTMIFPQYSFISKQFPNNKFNEQNFYFIFIFSMLFSAQISVIHNNNDNWIWKRKCFFCCCFSSRRKPNKIKCK
jgi:hypothetical protein